MKFFQFLPMFSFFLICSCGRPASDIVHPSGNPNLPLSGNDPSTGSAVTCNSGTVSARSANGNMLCVKRPEVSSIGGDILSDFWKNDTNSRCQSIKSYILSFAAEYFSNSTTEVIRCSKILENSNALFVSFLVNNTAGRNTISFEIADSENQGKPILVCTKDRTSFIAGTHCTERFVTGKIPTLVADLFPNPSPNFVDFFPSLSASLNN